MQKDMHFYGVYALARAAGIKPQAALTIAHASQFVDDALEGKEVVLSDRPMAILPVMTSHRPIDYQNALPGEQWKVWTAFHFLPGNRPQDTVFHERMICAKDSGPARAMLGWALSHAREPYGPHLAGIAAHAYADTFSHWGFLGLNSLWNNVRSDSIKIDCSSPSLRHYLWTKFDQFRMRALGSLAEAMPVGHGSVGTFPDRPYLSWRFDYEGSPRTLERRTAYRKNIDDFHEACEKLYGFFRRYAQANPGHAEGQGTGWGSIQGRVRDILRAERPEQGRIDAWLKAVGSGDLFRAVKADKSLSYSDSAWSPKLISSSSLFSGNPLSSDAFLFIKSASLYQGYIINDLLPSQGLLA